MCHHGHTAKRLNDNLVKSPTIIVVKLTFNDCKLLEKMHDTVEVILHVLCNHTFLDLSVLDRLLVEAGRLREVVGTVSLSELVLQVVSNANQIFNAAESLFGRI